MTGFSASSCFSPAHKRQHPSTSTADRLSGLLATLIASLSHLAARLKARQGGSPRKFVTNVSHKAMKMVHRRNRVDEMGRQVDQDEALWQRAILMGDKCQPLDFSGVIYYDENGKQISELPPRSPRSPLPYAAPRTH